MESFTNEERILYLRFVWGRSRLPDHNVFDYNHIISKYFKLIKSI